MARKKRNSQVLDKAQNRLSGIQSINEKLDLGAPLSAKQYTQYIDDLRDKVNTYNKTLSLVDEQKSEIDAAERFLAGYSEQFLLGIAAKFGKDSFEYEKAGGVRKSERKRPVRRVAVAAG